MNGDPKREKTLFGSPFTFKKIFDGNLSEPFQYVL